MHVALLMNSGSGMKILRSDFIRFLQSLEHQVTAVCPLDVGATSLRDMGVTVENWTVSRSSLSPLADTLSIVGLRRILLRIQPQVMLCFTPKAILLGSFAARATPACRLYSVFTGLGVLFGDTSGLIRMLSPVIANLFRLALKHNRVVFFQNPDDLRHFVSKQIVPFGRTCRVYGSGVDIRRFVPEKPPRSRPETVFLMVARLIAEKGIVEFIEAARILKSEHYPARFRLLGGFDDHPTAIDGETIRSSVHEGVIEYCGTTADVRPYLQDADVFVLPSYYREGTPRSTLEAMAMAKPIITTDSPGCRETVVDGHNGYLVPVRDPLSLAAAMRRLIGNHSRMHTMGARSRRLAEDIYNVEKVNDHMWRVVTESISGSPQVNTKK